MSQDGEVIDIGPLRKSIFSRLIWGRAAEGPDAHMLQTKANTAHGETPRGASGHAAKQKLGLQGSQVVTTRVKLRLEQRKPRRARQQQSNARRCQQHDEKDVHREALRSSKVFMVRTPF